MKHYLLTWYGVTDLRAALGLEPTDGPILSALKTKKYTDVVVLAYTNPVKSPYGITDELRAQWEQWRTRDVETRCQFPREQSQQFVDALSNTELGHKLFAEWLRRELSANGVAIDIQVVAKELRHLNDAQGIFDAASASVSHALADTSEKTITTYVSPGTPVMAYTWALIAIAHPQHKIFVISSSDPRLPPETIALPKDLLMPVITAPQTVKPAEYDVIIHLLGRERIPIYFGMLQFKASMHVFLTTHDYHHAGQILSRCLPTTCQSKTITIKDPFKPAETRRAIERQVSKLPAASSVAINLTGGTKLMFAGALAACWERGIEPFYFEINHHNIIFIRDGVTVPFIGARSVTDFFSVNGFDVITPGYWEDSPARAARMSVTERIWGGRRTLGTLYQSADFRRYRVPWGRTRNPTFDWKWGNSRASFNANSEALLILDGKAMSVPECGDFGQYLGGGWLEEYVWMLLRGLEVEGVIYDLRIGMEVGYMSKGHHPKDMPNGEFDCAFTDGTRLWLVECKAGNVKQEHIQKLENNLRTYGGIAAKGILVSSFTIVPPLMKRVRSSTSMHAVQAGEVTTDALRRIIGA